MNTAAFILFWTSIIFPVYTYVFYPVVLNSIPKKTRIYKEDYKPSVLVLIFSSNIASYRLKKEELAVNEYSLNRVEYQWVKGLDEINKAIEHTSCDIIIFLNEKYEYDLMAINNLILPFSDDNVGCVVGMQRKPLDDSGKIQDSIFWRYENLIKMLESGIGCVSGANDSIYAIRKELYSNISGKVKNAGFFISTLIQQKNADVIFEPSAIAYENLGDNSRTEGKKHIEDAIGYWQAFFVFWRMLLPRRKNFVYISHRVMKWLVPFNMAMLFFSNIILLQASALYVKFFWIQVFLYFIAGLWLNIKAKIKIKNPICSLLNIISYFLELNISYAIGFIKFVQKRIEMYDK